MDNRMFDPPEGARFVVSVSPQWVIEEALLESDEATVRERAARCFRAMNPLVKYDQTEFTLTQAAKEAERALKRLNRDLHATDAVETTVSAEIATKPHWMTRVAGMATAGLCIALLAPLPIVVSLAVSESLLIDYVVEYPLLGAMYGLVSIGIQL